MVELKLCRRSELHGKNLVSAPAVVDAVEQVDVALYAPQLLFRLTRRVNKLGLVGAEAVNEPLPVVLAVVQLHEVDDTLNHLGSEGIRVAAPGFQQDGERFLIELRPGAPELRKIRMLYPTSAALFEELFFRCIIFFVLLKRFDWIPLPVMMMIVAALFIIEQVVCTQKVKQAVAMAVGALAISFAGCLMIVITNSIIPAIICHEMYVIFYLKK